MNGWMYHLGFSESVLKRFDKEEIDSVEELMHVDDSSRTKPYNGKYDIPKIQSKVREEGIGNIKLRLSKEAGDDIRFMDYSALLDELELAYFRDIPVEDLGLENRALNVLKNRNLSTLADICVTPATKIARFRNLGQKSLTNIIDTRHQWYLKLKQDGVPESVKRKYSHGGIRYASIVEKLSRLIVINVDDMHAALDGLSESEKPVLTKDITDLTKEDYLFVFSKVKKIHKKLMEAIGNEMSPPYNALAWETEDIKDFDRLRYIYKDDLSSDTDYVFERT